MSSNDFKMILHEQALILVAKLYNNSSLSQTQIQSFIEDYTNFLSSSFFSIIISEISESYITDKNKIDILKMLDALLNPFQNLMSYHKRLKSLTESHCLIQPIQYIIGQRMVSSYNCNKITYKCCEVTGQFIPLREIFKKILIIPNFLNTVLKHMSNLEEYSEFSNLIQSDLWILTVSCFKRTDIVLPLLVYFDDFKKCNPLGSHSGEYKLGAVYVSIGCLPPQYMSSLKNIFLAR